MSYRPAWFDLTDGPFEEVITMEGIGTLWYMNLSAPKKAKRGEQVAMFHGVDCSLIEPNKPAYLVAYADGSEIWSRGNREWAMQTLEMNLKNEAA